MVCLWAGLPPHVVGIFQQLGQAQYSHKRREILGRNLVKGKDVYKRQIRNRAEEIVRHELIYDAKEVL